MSDPEKILNKFSGKHPIRRYTYDELMAELSQTTQPCELWDGEICMEPTPSYYHQEIVLRMYARLNDWVTQHDLGKVITGPVDMVLSPHLFTQPDVAYVSKRRLHIIQRGIMGAADWVAEVVSLGHRHRDRIQKRDLYEQYDVKEYWIIDPESEMVEVLRIASSRYQLWMRCESKQEACSHLLPGFRMPLSYLFHGQQASSSLLQIGNG